MKKILVSECLYGGRIVRYDGGEKALNHPTFLKWKAEGRLIPVCPEVMGGLPVPRPDSQRVGQRIVTRQGQDVTEQYTMGACEAVRIAREHDVCCCIMKESSPACGSSRIHDGSFTGKKISGQGIAVEYLREAGFPVFAEEEIEEAAAFLQKCGEDEKR